MVAITGTNGKTTTTALTALLVERAGRRVAMAGNIGPDAAADAGADARRRSGARHLPEVWVLELSSFQLDGVQGFEPDAATVLNITQDHLDWHGTMQAYAAAKARVFGTHAVMVINRDDPPVDGDGARAAARQSAPASRVARRTAQVVRFGLDAPQRPGDFGLDRRERHGLAGARAREPTKPSEAPQATPIEEICTCSA